MGGRKRRGGGVPLKRKKKKKKKRNRVRNKVFVSGCPPFSISAGQREQANMIFSPMCQQKTDRVRVRSEGRRGGGVDRKETGWRGRKGMSKWKKMGGKGEDLKGCEMKEWDES